MNLIELVRRHWIYGVTAVVIGSSTVTWKVAGETLVKPRDYAIRQLEKRIRELEDRIDKAEGTGGRTGGTSRSDAPEPVIPKKVFLHEQLPREGQVIIPRGLRFQVTPNMQGNARKFKKQDEIDDVIEFSSAVGKDRANLYDKSIADFPTVIWENSDKQDENHNVPLDEYPANNTIKNPSRSLVLFSNEHIIMFEYRIDYLPR